MFGAGIEADIRLHNAEDGPYVDPVLFADGHEVALHEPEFERSDRQYDFQYDGTTYSVLIAAEEP